MRRLSNLLRRRRPAPAPSLEGLTWRCHVCGSERPDRAIAVASRTILVGGVEMQMNVRYCVDRVGLNGEPNCRAGAERQLDERQEALSPSERCPSCDSPHPHLHPAVQFEGEVQPCSHPFHERVTSQNTPERIAETQGILERTR